MPKKEVQYKQCREEDDPISQNITKQENTATINHNYITIKGDVEHCQFGEQSCITRQSYEQNNSNSVCKRELKSVKQHLRRVENRVRELEIRDSNNQVKLEIRDQTIRSLEEKLRILEIDAKRENRSLRSTLVQKDDEINSLKNEFAQSLPKIEIAEGEIDKFLSIKACHFTTGFSQTMKVKPLDTVKDVEKQINEMMDRKDVFVTNICRRENNKSSYLWWCFKDKFDKTLKEYGVKEGDSFAYSYT